MRNETRTLSYSLSLSQVSERAIGQLADTCRPFGFWDTLTCSQHDDDATQKPSQPPLAVAVGSGKTSKLLQEYPRIRNNQVKVYDT